MDVQGAIRTKSEAYGKIVILIPKKKFQVNNVLLFEPSLTFVVTTEFI